MLTKFLFLTFSLGVIFPVYSQMCNHQNVSIPFYSGMRTGNTDEVSAVDVFIDEQQTSIVKLENNNYRFKSLVKVQKENGGDDDVSGLDGILLLPGDCVITKLSVTFRNRPLQMNVYKGQVHFCLDTLFSCDCGIEIFCEFTKNDQKKSLVTIGIGAFPRSPSDVFPVNNYWSWQENVKNTLIISKSKLVKFGGVIPKIDVPEICKWVVQCPGCGTQRLCSGDIIDFRELSPKIKATLHYLSKSGKPNKVKSKNGKIKVPDDYHSDENTYLIINKK